MSNLKDQFLNARRFGVPLLAIETPDQGATIQTLVQAINGDKKQPILTWDIVRGMMAGNESGKDAMNKLWPREDLLAELINPTVMLSRIIELPDKAVVFMYNAPRFYENEAVAQGIWNLRDPFKASGRMLVLLGASIKLPVEIERDVIMIDEPLPTDDELGSIVSDVYQSASLKAPTKENQATIGRALRGLAPFPAEQAVALSLSKEGADLGKVWELKRKMIEQTRGLSFYRSGETFNDIGGMERLKRFGQLLFEGSKPPTAVVWVDEIEKQMAGAAGDMSGTSQDQLGVLLSAMEDNKWNGLIAVGPPGCAKSLFSKALPFTYGAPCIRLDMGALKGSLVGQSEQQARQAIKVIQAVAGESAYWVATCNKLDNLPPEFRRRFTDGIWFSDLPTAEERAMIWKIQQARFAVPKNQSMPDDTDWTGADIRNVCSIASRLRCTLQEAATYITPVAKSDPESIEKLRRLADGSFLSANQPGVYKRNLSNTSSAGRKVAL